MAGTSGPVLTDVVEKEGGGLAGIVREAGMTGDKDQEMPPQVMQLAESFLMMISAMSALLSRTSSSPIAVQ